MGQNIEFNIPRKVARPPRGEVTARFTKDEYEYWLVKPLYGKMEVLENDDQRRALYLAIERCIDPYHRQYLRGIVTYNNNDMNGGN